MKSDDTNVQYCKHLSTSISCYILGSHHLIYIKHLIWNGSSKGKARAMKAVQGSSEKKCSQDLILVTLCYIEGNDGPYV
jgi:hypothetical protein